MKRVGIILLTCLLSVAMHAEFEKSLTVQDWALALRLEYSKPVHYVGGSVYGGYSQFKLNGADLSIPGGGNAGIAFQYKLERKAFRMVAGLDATYAGSSIKDPKNDMIDIPMVFPDTSMTYRFMLYGMDEKQHSIEVGVRLLMGFDYKGVYFLAGMRAGLPVWSQYKITTYANRIILDEKTIDYYSDMPNHWLYADASACKDQLHLNFNPQVSAELGFNMDKWLAYHPRHKRSPTRKPQDRELVHYELAAYANVGCITDYRTCHNEPLLTYNPVGGVIEHVRSHFDDAAYAVNRCMPWNVGIKFNIYYEIYDKPKRPRPGTDNIMSKTKPVVQSSSLVNVKGKTKEMPRIRLTFANQTFYTGDTIVLQNIYFDSDKYFVRDESKPSLNELATFMKNHKNLKLTLIGHTDNTNTAEYNMRLSYNRVRSVKQELMNRGVESSRIKTIGRGQTEPVATNETEEGKQLNRRVEMTFDVLEE